MNREELIHEAFEGKKSLEEAKEAVLSTLKDLDLGRLRVCEKTPDGWKTNFWVKEAILLFFRIQSMVLIECGPFRFVDKIPVKRWKGDEGVRVVPQAIVREGAYIEKGAILMPSYVNLGAYVGEGTMVDTWATVGSCAQIGKYVHLSGGVGIGGVLEPVQASPVIIEDHVFIGSRCIVVEGAVIEENAVLGAGVVITASTKIIDVSQSKEVVYRGRVPKNSVVIPGTQIKKFAAGDYQVPCALIIGQRTEATDRKTSLTAVLRDFDVAV